MLADINLTLGLIPFIIHSHIITTFCSYVKYLFSSLLCSASKPNIQRSATPTPLLWDASSQPVESESFLRNPLRNGIRPRWRRSRNQRAPGGQHAQRMWCTKTMTRRGRYAGRRLRDLRHIQAIDPAYNRLPVRVSRFIHPYLLKKVFRNWEPFCGWLIFGITPLLG